MRVYVDIETFSSVDLPKTGVYRYASSPDFLILMAAWSVDGETVEIDLDQDSVLRRFHTFREAGATFVAHNAQFERVCFSAAIGLPPGEYLPPEIFHDTQAVAAELGFPQKLEKLAPALGVQEKDAAGTRLINLFCKMNRKGQRTLPEEKPMEWLDFIAYCEQDVYTLIDCDRRLENLGGWPTETEYQVFLADQAINDRGIAIDVPLARKAVRTGKVNQEWQKARVTELTGVENPGSVQQLSVWLNNELPERIPNLQSETVEKLLRGNLPADVREVLGLRQELALAAPAKFSAALGAVLPDGRLRGTLKFFGAHTGRWAGRGTQLQNLPRHAFDNDADTGLCIAELMAGEDVSSDDLKRLVRPMFRGPFTVVDYSAIEARVIAWLAGEEWALEAFRDGRDIYVETAERMGGLSRYEGKIAVLALGYNGGAGSLRAMAGEGTLGGHTDDQLYDLFVYPWRNANRRIVRLWKTLEERFRTGGPIGDHLRFEKQGRDRLLRLPSGRFIAYRKCGVVEGLKGPRLQFASPGYGRIDTYGGRLAENATQAVARDILAEALVRLERNGFVVAAHVHDEILVDGNHDPDHISEIMCDLPSWATGLPVNAEGFSCERYKKG